MPPKRPGAAPKVPERQTDLPLKYRIATHLDLPTEAHAKWVRMVQTAETLVEEDVDLQLKVLKGLRLKQRFLPPEVLGRLYARYCDLINDLYEAYLHNIQMQRVEYIQEIISIVVKRMYELRNELVHLIVNDYIYADNALLQLLKTPFDIQIVVPYHFAADSRPGSVEAMLQSMWLEAEKRQKKKEKMEQRAKDPKNKKSKDVFGGSELGLGETEMADEEIEEEEEEEDVLSVHTQLSEDFIQASIIQKHERYRQYAYRAFLERVQRYRTYFAKKVSEDKQVSREFKARAVGFIQKFYRRFMELKRIHLRDDRRDVVLGIVPDVDHRPKSYVVEYGKLTERRRQKRIELGKRYQEQIEKEKKRLLFFKKGEFIEDITEEVIEWWKEWYKGYGFFPPYPYELEGGTIVVATGEYETIEERQLEDEKYAKATKGKTKETLKQERIQAKIDEIAKKEMLLERLKKEKIALFKARCNPQTDPGYEPQQSEVTPRIVEVLRRYRQAWSLFDEFPVGGAPEIVYGFMEPLVIENILQDLHLECRKYVDELMRIEVKTLIKAQQTMFRLVGWKWPKLRPRKKPKPIPEPKPFIVDENMIKGVEKVFDIGIMSKPTTKFSDVGGDLKFAAYESNLRDALATFPSPGYGDARRRVILSCVFGSGLEPGAPRNKSVMLLGIPRNGKSFMVDAAAGEMNAVKFDISPEVLSAKVKRPGKILSQVFQAARIFQPSVIFCKNIERVFYKRVPPAEKKQKAKALKGPLTKLLKAMPLTEKVIFIATCSDPTVARVRPMMKLFTEKILIPSPDYGTIQALFYNRLQKIHSMPRDYCVQALAQIMQGLGYGFLMEMFDDILNPDRIVKLNCDRLHPSEFVEYLIERDIEPMESKQYQKLMDLYIQYSPLKVERQEYAIINMTRDYAYKKFEEVEKKKEEDKAKKAGK